MPNWTKISGVLRHLLTFGGGYVVAKGVVDEATMNEIIAGTMTIVGVLWSWLASEKKA